MVLGEPGFAQENEEGETACYARNPGHDWQETARRDACWVGAHQLRPRRARRLRVRLRRA